MANYLEDILNYVIEGEDEDIGELIQEALESGIPANDILKQGLIAAMDIVGAKMESGEMYIPEVLLSAETMRVGLDLVKPLLSEGDMSSSGKVVIGTVEGDLHDIGKNLVAMMLEVSGFEVVDLGIDQSVEAFLEACENEKPDVVGLSALLTTTMEAMKEICEAVKDKHDQVKVVVGGAPITEEFAQQIGADGYSDDAGSAVALCKQLVG